MSEPRLDGQHEETIVRAIDPQIVLEIKKHFHPNTDKVDITFVTASDQYTYNVGWWRGFVLGMPVGLVLTIIFIITVNKG